MSLERPTSESFSNKQIPTGGNAFLRLHPMSLQNVISMLNDSLSHRLFNLHSIDFNQTSSSSFALYLEVPPLSVNLSYLMTSRFDRSPILNSNKRQRAFSTTRKLFGELVNREDFDLSIQISAEDHRVIDEK